MVQAIERYETPEQTQKRRRSILMEHALVEYNNYWFHADETSQERMMRAISFAGNLGIETLNWITANGEMVSLTVEDLQKILALAMRRQYDIFLKAKQGLLTAEDVKNAITMWNEKTLSA